jgi:hypothetical protein
VINLRYHIISIVAVFLALGIGLALGSTFVDSVLVSNLESQVNQLAETEAAAEGQRDTLEDEIQRLNDESDSTVAALEPLIGVGRLDEQPIVIIANESVDRKYIEALRSTILSSNANFGGIIFVTEDLDPADAEVRTVVADLFDLAGSGEGAVTRGLMFLLSQAMFDPASSTISSQGGAGNATALSVLRDNNLLAFEATFGVRSVLESLPRENTRFVLAVDDNAGEQIQNFFEPLLRRIADDGYGGSLVIVDPADEAGLVDIVRFDENLRDEFSTIDGASTLLGQLAAIIALEQLPVTGHHGVLPSASDVAPTA